MNCSHFCSQHSTCLSTVPVFNGMDKTDLQILQKVTKSRQFNKGDLIFQEGECSQKLFLVHEGLIKLTKLSSEGKEQIVRILFPGDFFGLLSLLRDENHYENAIALSATEVCSIEKKDFLKTMEDHADLTFHFLLAISNLLYEADESIGFLGLMEVEQRLARALILFYEKMGAKDNTFLLPISKKDLACFIGTTPESISRKFVTFTRQKLIYMEGRRKIQILELDKLKKLAGII